MEAQKWCIEYHSYQIVNAFVADSTEEVGATINIIKDLMESEQSAQQSGEEDGILLKESLKRKSPHDQSQILKVLAIFCCKLWKKDFGSESDSILETLNDYINFLYDVCLPNDDRKIHMIKAANTQRILELSRSNRKRLAKKLYSEVERKEGCLYPKDVKAAIYTTHEMPEHLMYHNFLLDMKQMVAMIFETFKAPFLFELANVVKQHPTVDLKMDAFLSRIQKKQNTCKETETAISKRPQHTISHTVSPGPAADLSESPEGLTIVTADKCSKEGPSKITPQKKATFLSFKTRDIWRAYPALSFSSRKKLNKDGKGDSTHTATDQTATQEERGKKGVEQHQKRKVQIKTSVEGKSSDGGDNLAMTKEGGKEERHGANRSQKGMRRRGREVSPEESSSDISDFCDVKQRRRVARSGQKRARKRYDDSEDEFDSNEENRQGFSRERTRGENDVNNYRRKLRESPRQIEYLDVPKEVDRVRRSEGKRMKETYDNSEDEYETNEDNRQRVSREGARGENDIKIYKRKSRKASRQAEDDDIPKGGDGVTRSEGKRTKETYDNSEDVYETNEDNRQRVSREGARGENDVKIYKRKSRKASREAEDDDVPKGVDRMTRSEGKRTKETYDNSEDVYETNEDNRQRVSREGARGENDVKIYKRKSRKASREAEDDDIPKGGDGVTRSEGKRTKETYDNSEDEYESNEDNRQRVSREGARGENDVKICKRKSRKASREAEDDDVPKGSGGVTRSRVVMIKSSASDSEVSPSLFDESDEDRTKEKAGKTTQTRTSSGQGCSSNKSLQKKSSRIAGPSGKDNRQKDVTPKKRSSNKTRRSNDSFSEGESISWTPENDSTTNMHERQRNMRERPRNAVTHQKRRFFTHDEETYLRQGVRRFGVGSWAKILENYPFENRTSVNLKDKYRNLIKNGAA
eukprot:Seg2380.4 transcript_id=Seg2380.4/GoldUCD/mRNA.D3Y31 product="Telomeric repeat-binding factor 2" protein_id=Seg2380.4/GoldUCD/D3Y31